MNRVLRITLRSNRVLGMYPPDGDQGGILSLTPLGLVISEHIDKISFFEPALTVLDKTVEPDRVSFVLRSREPLAKPLDEIIRGFRIGCFHIAREYHLVSPEDPSPIFTDGFEAVNV